MKEFFRRFASRASHAVGSPWAFMAACAVVIMWAAFGPRFHWSDSHSLFINTLTTIITFLMVFLIQNTQNRDTQAVQLKLSELIKATKGARNSLIDLDALSDEQLKLLEDEYRRICYAPNERGDDPSAS